MKQWVFFIFTCGLVAAALGCGPTFSAVEDDPAAETLGGAVLEDGLLRIPERSLAFLEINAVSHDPARAAVRAPGQVVFQDGAVAHIGAPIAGRVSEVHARVGDRVRRDDVLVTLISPEAASARAELAGAKAEVQAARTELQRQNRLLAGGIGVERDRFEAETRVAEAEAALASAELAVAFLGNDTGATVHVRAPIDGMVLDRDATVGATVDPGGSPLLTIGDPAALWVMVDVFVDDLPLVEEGARAMIEVATIPKPLQGRVESVGAVLRRQLRRAPVYIAIDTDELNGVSLRNGMYARARIDSAILQGVMVPASAVVIKEGRRYVVYVEVKKGGTRFEQREVVVGQVVDDHVQVLSGLDPGERIVRRGALLLDGTADLLQ